MVRKVVRSVAALLIAGSIGVAGNEGGATGGKAGCGTCPDIVNKLLQNVAIKAWCSYVCVETGTSPAKVVAVGAGGISALKNIFFGPVCISYP